jgi:hypothetical protein
VDLLVAVRIVDASFEIPARSLRTTIQPRHQFGVILLDVPASVEMNSDRDTAGCGLQHRSQQPIVAAIDPNLLDEDPLVGRLDLLEECVGGIIRRDEESSAIDGNGFGIVPGLVPTECGVGTSERSSLPVCFPLGRRSPRPIALVQ